MTDVCKKLSLIVTLIYRNLREIQEKPDVLLIPIHPKCVGYSYPTTKVGI